MHDIYLLLTLIVFANLFWTRDKASVTDELEQHSSWALLR